MTVHDPITVPVVSAPWYRVNTAPVCAPLSLPDLLTSTVARCCWSENEQVTWLSLFAMMPLIVLVVPLYAPGLLPEPLVPVQDGVPTMFHPVGTSSWTLCGWLVPLVIAM